MDAFLYVLLSSVILAAPAAVPDVCAGPALAEEAEVVEAPLHDVTVYSDRARVRRKAKLNLKAGIHKLRLPDLPGAVLIDTVRVECLSVRVLRVETVPVQRERFSIEQVEEHIGRLEKLTDQLTALSRKAQVINLELGFLRGITPRSPVDESKRVGRPEPPLVMDVWVRVLDFLDKRKDSCRSTLRELSVEQRSLNGQIAQVQREVQRHNLGAFTDRKVQVVAIVQVRQATTAGLTIEYFVPGASWRPAYNVHFDPEHGRVILKTAGRVQQATGEDWSGVSLSLSTAIPGQGVHLPELLTWALGEKREFIPRPRAARMPRVATRFPPPAQQPTTLEAERSARLQVLRQRIAELQNLTSKRFDGGVLAALGSTTGVGGLGLQGQGSGGGGAGLALGNKRTTTTRSRRSKSGRRGRPSSATRAPPPPPRSAPSAPRPSVAAVSEAHAVSRDMESEDAPAARPGRSMGTSLGLFEPTYYQPPQFSDSSLPAVVAGGLDYVYESPAKADIPSTGVQLRVPLAADSYPVETFYEATPSLKKTAYLKAKVVNRGQRPILQGPANIFVGKDFTGQGQLKTTGTGGSIELPLGADEDIRLLHKVVPSTVTEGVISKDEVTTYTTTIEIGNYKRRAVTIIVVDQIPKTRNEDIEIEKSKITPRPQAGPDADGIMRWKLKIPAGKTHTIQFSYKIERPENWQLTQ